MLFFEDLLRGAFFVALFAGCDSGSATERSADHAPAPTSDEAAAKAVQDSATPTRQGGLAGPLQRGKLLGGEPVERAPVWPAAGDPDTAAGGMDLSAATRQAIQESSVPVLLPHSGDPWSEALRVIPLGDDGYSLHTRAERSKLVLQASGVARLYEDLPGDRGRSQIRGVPGHLTENEGILSASWIERGTSYTADLECGDVEADECSAEGFLRLLDTLVFVEAPQGKNDAQDQGVGQ